MVRACSRPGGLPLLAALAAALALVARLPPLVAGNAVLDDLDRPQAASKVNIHGWSSSSDDGSSDSSSDDDGSSGDGGGRQCLRRLPNGSCQVWDNVQHFANDFGELEMKWSSCDDPYEDPGGQDDFEEVAAESSLYQRVLFEENLTGAGDKCLRLDDTLQQCASYRPHYHEPFVHLSAAYLNEGYLSGVRRVVFVGGGDSMLLHEILKYPQLELVLGLELDQKVTRNSFEHFKTQPHFDDPRVQWWFGDGAKSLTLLPREYFGTFDLVLLDLSETVMSMTVTTGLDVFGAMKLLLAPTGILVKNDFGYFEKLAKVFDTCMQLLLPDVTYICDYELVLCASDEVDFLEPTFDHLKGIREGKVDTLVYRPQDDSDDHWAPVSDYSKYWGEPRQCFQEGEDNGIDLTAVAHAGVLMIVEAEHVALPLDDVQQVADALADALTALGFRVLPDAFLAAGAALVIPMTEGYVLVETYPDAKYCKVDLHLWGRFEKQEAARAALLAALGSAAGDWQSYRIVTGGVRGVDTRAADLAATGPDLAQIGRCAPPREGSAKAIAHDASPSDRERLQPVIDAGYDDILPMMVGPAAQVSAVVLCDVAGAPCPARDNLARQGFATLITLHQCSAEEERRMDAGAVHRGRALTRWREAMADPSAVDLSLCGKKTDVALKEVAKKIRGVQVVVADPAVDGRHVHAAHLYWGKFWQTLKKPFLLLVPILDAGDQPRTAFLRSRHNHGEEEPEFYSELYVGDGTRTLSFGMIHEGHADSLRGLLRAQVKLEQNAAVRFTDVRQITIRGATREQGDGYDPQTFAWDAYDQAPGLAQFYGQRPVGLQSVFQLGLTAGAGEGLSAATVAAAFRALVGQWGAVRGETSYQAGVGAVHAAVTSRGQAAAVWDGADGVTVTVFTHDEAVDHLAALAPFTAALPPTDLRLRDEQPRGHGKVITRADRVDRDESPACYDHFKMCKPLTAKGNCDGGDGAREWMRINCRFSCKHCDGKSSFANKDEL